MSLVPVTGSWKYNSLSRRLCVCCMFLSVLFYDFVSVHEIPSNTQIMMRKGIFSVFDWTRFSRSFSLFILYFFRRPMSDINYKFHGVLLLPAKRLNVMANLPFLSKHVIIK